MHFVVRASVNVQNAKVLYNIHTIVTSSSIVVSVQPPLCLVKSKETEKNRCVKGSMPTELR